MRKTILAVATAGFVASTLVPTPASAFVFVFLPAVLMAKEDKNFKAVNPYAPVKKAKAGKSKKKKA